MSKMICGKCGVAMEPRKAKLRYLGHEFWEELPSCPICGQVYISEELAIGKIRTLESTLEEK